MAEKKLNLLITAKDQASGVLKQLGVAGLGGVSSALSMLANPIALVTAGLTALAKQWIDNVDAAKKLTESIDDLSDRLGISVQEAERLYGISKIMGVSIESLEKGFVSLAKNGIDPSVEGLRVAREQLQGVTDSGERLKLGQQLLGKSYRDLNELLSLSNEEFDRYVEMGPDLIAVSEAATKAQDAHNKSMNEAKFLQESINALNMKGGVITKDTFMLWVEQQKAISDVVSALDRQGVEGTFFINTMAEAAAAVKAVNAALEFAIDVRGKTIQQIEAEVELAKLALRADEGRRASLIDVATAERERTEALIDTAEADRVALIALELLNGASPARLAALVAEEIAIRALTAAKRADNAAASTAIRLMIHMMELGLTPGQAGIPWVFPDDVPVPGVPGATADPGDANWQDWLDYWSTPVDKRGPPPPTLQGGGPVTAPVTEVGEAGTEGLIRMPDGSVRVIPHEEWLKMRGGWGRMLGHAQDGDPWWLEDDELEDRFPFNSDPFDFLRDPFDPQRDPFAFTPYLGPARLDRHLAARGSPDLAPAPYYNPYASYYAGYENFRAPTTSLEKALTNIQSVGAAAAQLGGAGIAEVVAAVAEAARRGASEGAEAAAISPADTASISLESGTLAATQDSNKILLQILDEQRATRRELGKLSETLPTTVRDAVERA